jgi:hypothetical protein
MSIFAHHYLTDDTPTPPIRPSAAVIQESAEELQRIRETEAVICDEEMLDPRR